MAHVSGEHHAEVHSIGPGDHGSTEEEPFDLGAGSDGSGDAELDQAIAALRARIDEEFRITERLDVKARQAFGLAAAIAGLVQAFAFGAFAEQGLTDTDRVVLMLVAIPVLVAAAVCGHRLADADEPLVEDDVRPEAIRDWVFEADDNQHVRLKLIDELAATARSRVTNNETRAERLDRVQTAARWTLILAVVEFITAVVLRA